MEDTQMVLFAFICFGAVGYCAWCYRSARKFEQEWKVWDEHWDLKNKLYTLIEDPWVSELELRSYKPICQFADERFERLFLSRHPTFSNQRKAVELLEIILS